jgi:hypothetical protein
MAIEKCGVCERPVHEDLITKANKRKMCPQCYDSERVTVELECKTCRKIVPISVKVKDYSAWNRGAKTQDAFPYLEPGEREMFISATCDTCWDEMWKEED